MRHDRGRLLARLGATLGDFALAEDALQDAVSKALCNWPKHGLPDAPQAWLFQVAKRQAIDTLRRAKSFEDKALGIVALAEGVNDPPPQDIPDDRLRLIFTCCHPALDEEARLALTLVSLGGLTTAEVAKAFVVKTTTMAARVTRAKAKIKRAGIAFAIPEPKDLQPRLKSVLRVVYLIYNQGYSNALTDSGLRLDLCQEALFLGALLDHLLPNTPEIMGLRALMLFSYARRAARFGPDGDMIPLTQQDRSQWDQENIVQADTMLQSALRLGQVGPYQLQAAIHGVHAAAKTADNTDWNEIVGLYSVLHRMEPTEVVALNQAVAVSFARDTQAGLVALTWLGDKLGSYQPFHSAKADMLRRQKSWNDAIAAYERALALTEAASDRRFLEKQKQSCLDEIRKKKAEHVARPSPTGR